jgi:hypothetical protein
LSPPSHDGIQIPQSPNHVALRTIERDDDVEDDNDAIMPVGQEVPEAAMALAQLSLRNHHGEYFGRGTIV